MAEAIDYAKEKGIDLGGVLFDREYKLEQNGEE
jgi:hypothetical protein